MATARLSLLMIRTADVERAVAFYRGLGLEFERERHGSGPIHYAARCDGTVFEIYPARPGALASSSVRLGFRVQDLREATAALVGAGGSLAMGANQGRSVVVDPDGNSVELTADAHESPATRVGGPAMPPRPRPASFPEARP